MARPVRASRPTVPRAEIIVVPSGSNLVEDSRKPFSVICFSVSRTQISVGEGASTTENQGISPSQYSGMEVFGVPPPITSIVSRNGSDIHPLGISPDSDSSNESGNMAAVATSMPSGWRPSILACTGSKSTNQDLKMAWAMDSRVLLVSRRRVMRSSSASRNSTSLPCSVLGGTGTGKCAIESNVTWGTCQT